MGLEDLGDLAINAIISKLDAKDTVAVSCVSKKLRVSASEESLWLNHCSQDLGLSAPIDPLGKPAPSFKVIFLIFSNSFFRFSSIFFLKSDCVLYFLCSFCSFSPYYCSDLFQIFIIIVIVCFVSLYICFRFNSCC